MPTHRTRVPASSSNSRSQESRLNGLHWGGVVVRTATLRLGLRLGLELGLLGLRHRGSGGSDGPPSGGRGGRGTVSRALGFGDARGVSRPGKGMNEIPEGGRRPEIVVIVVVVVVLGRLEGRPGGIGLPVSHRSVDLSSSVGSGSRVEYITDKKVRKEGEKERKEFKTRTR